MQFTALNPGLFKSAGEIFEQRLLRFPFGPVSTSFLSMYWGTIMVDMKGKIPSQNKVISNKRNSLLIPFSILMFTISLNLVVMQPLLV